MIADPKPPTRAPKPIKRIPRRRAKPRTTKTQCIVRGCKKSAEHIARCRPHADEYLLKLRRALVVKPGVCEIADWHEPGGPLGMSGFMCSQVIQDNHGIDRDYKRSNLRWDPENGFSGCSAANIYAHFHGEEWRDYLRKKWGPEKYERLREASVRGPMPDYEAALAMLSGQKAEEG